jgi:hypothetical protein
LIADIIFDIFYSKQKKWLESIYKTISLKKGICSPSIQYNFTKYWILYLINNRY